MNDIPPHPSMLMDALHGAVHKPEHECRGRLTLRSIREQSSKVILQGDEQMSALTHLQNDRCPKCDRKIATNEDFPLPIVSFDQLPKLNVCFRFTGSQNINRNADRIRGGLFKLYDDDVEDNYDGDRNAAMQSQIEWDIKAMKEQMFCDCEQNEVDWRARAIEAETKLKEFAELIERWPRWSGEHHCIENQVDGRCVCCYENAGRDAACKLLKDVP